MAAPAIDLMGVRRSPIPFRLKLRVLALARRIGNVAEACRRLDVSRSHFYALRERYLAHGIEGLRERRPARPRMPNETPSHLVALILTATGRFPTYSYGRLSRRLAGDGHCVSPAQIRGVWERHGLGSCAARLAWLERTSGRSLSARHRRLLESGRRVSR